MEEEISMTNEPSADVARAADSDRPVASADSLSALTEAASRARDLQLEMDDLESILLEKKLRLRRVYEEELPALMDAAGTDRVGVPASGNKPGVDFELRSLHRASISSRWDEERREAAFAVLRRNGADSLIKTTVEARLPKGNVAAARRIVAAIRKLRIKGGNVDMRMSVHAATLSAWLRSVYEDERRSLPSSDLEAIGAFVGRVVRIKGRDE